MAKPTKGEYRQLTRQALLRRFNEECLLPARARVQAKPNSLFDEQRLLIKEAKAYFRSRYGDLPQYKKAIYLFVKARLVEWLNDEALVEEAFESFDGDHSPWPNARLILLPMDSWDTPCYFDPKKSYREEGFAQYAHSWSQSHGTERSSSSSPPPPRDPVELDLETKVLRAEQELEQHRVNLKLHREAKQKAAEEQAERERVARQKAEQEAREKVEREAREKSARERRAQEQDSQRASCLPQWALILEISPPYSEDQIRTSYRKMSKLTHPDVGGTAKEFREVDSAYDDAMKYCRSLRA